MSSDTLPTVNRGGPFRLLKYFIVSAFVVITVVTFLLAAFLYTRSINTLLKGAESYARLLAENLNYNIYIGFYGPLKARGIPMDLRKWDQFGSLDSLIKDFTYGLKIRRIKIIDRNRKIVYSTEYDLIGKYESSNPAVDQALDGKDLTQIEQERDSLTFWQGNWLTDTYYPLREVSGNFWMLGNIYGVIQVTQDVTDQYVNVQRSILVVMLVAIGLMVFLFIMLTLIVRRGEMILLERAREQKKLEEKLQQSEKLASIGQMVATIAHEIRNPLGIIRSSAQVLAKAENPDVTRIRKLSGVIVEEASSLSNILTDFLEFARPRSPSLRNIDVSEVIARVRNNLDQEIQSRHIVWEDTNLEAVDASVQGDPELLYRAFLNVAINAFEAMENGGKFAINISTQDSMVRVDFADSGHGINEADLPKIFTPFFTTHEMGTGLGLSVVHNIITAHGGEINVKSEAGHGAVFTILLQPGNSSSEVDSGSNRTER
ncbi:MAG TPA: ATP-binding protein [Desulfomonilaceae bacterium]|nr:ATP-binding protein [Desulfomonilaceae bacterium]